LILESRQPVGNAKDGTSMTSRLKMSLFNHSFQPRHLYGPAISDSSGVGSPFDSWQNAAHHLNLWSRSVANSTVVGCTNAISIR
jgi:hypothetical protein